MWLAVLSDQLRIVGLVGRYPPNYLIRRKPLPALPPKGHFLHHPLAVERVRS